MNSIRDLLADATKRLRANSETPEIDAQALLARALGRDRSWLFAWPELVPDADTREAFAALLARREHGEPVAYLTGEREFWSLSLTVTADTLIPRPETELLVETLLALDLPDDARVLDLGTGSGALALALATERPRWRITASDRSTAALEVAQGNGERLGLCNVVFCRGDWFEALARDARFDAIVSNPPYVADNDTHLARGDVRFEPAAALRAGSDGLDALRTIIRHAPDHLDVAGYLWLEHGADQGRAVRELLASARFGDVATQLDFAGLARCSGGKLALTSIE